jgi:hypothetical protein
MYPKIVAIGEILRKGPLKIYDENIQLFMETSQTKLQEGVFSLGRRNREGFEL